MPAPSQTQVSSRFNALDSFSRDDCDNDRLCQVITSLMKGTPESVTDGSRDLMPILNQVSSTLTVLAKVEAKKEDGGISGTTTADVLLLMAGIVRLVSCARDAANSARPFLAGRSTSNPRG